MAFSILVKLKEGADWGAINAFLMRNSQGIMEFFPIAKLPFSSEEYLGISVLLRKAYQEEELDAFKRVMYFLLKNGGRVFELYSSTEFSVENISTLTDKYFGQH